LLGRAQAEYPEYRSTDIYIAHSVDFPLFLVNSPRTISIAVLLFGRARQTQSFD